MALFKRESPPSIKGEMEKLDEKDRSTESVKQDSELKYTPELLQRMQEELADARKHLDEVNADNTIRTRDLRDSDLDFWRDRIANASRTIGKLEALRDKGSTKE